jgi:osmoprotectant transport system permease protein
MMHWLEDNHHVKLLGSLGFENTYALAISEETSKNQKISSLLELSVRAPALRIGSDYEFFGRPEWQALKERYGLRFAEQRTFDPSLMYEAIQTKSVEVISAYSTDGRIADYKLVVLGDPLGALPPYDAVLLLSPGAAKRPELVAALLPVVGAISDHTMREANKMVDVERRSVTDAAVFLQQATSTGKAQTQ